MRQARPMCAAMTAGLLLLTACNDGDNEPNPEPPPIGGEENEDDDPTENEEDPPEEDEPYAVPDEIDEAYAEEVINVLLEIDTEALKIVLEQEPGEVIAPEAADRLAAASAGQRLASSLETFQIYVNRPETRDAFLPPDEMGTSRFEAHGVLHAEPDACILVVGWWDRTEIAVDATDEPSLFSLGPVDRDVTDVDRNPTPWQIREINRMMMIDDEPVPEDRWDDIDFGDELDRTCEER